MPVGFSLLLATSDLSWRKRQSGPSSSFLKAWEADTSLLVLMWLCRMLTILNERIFSNLMAAVHLGLQKSLGAFLPFLEHPVGDSPR